MVIYFTLFLPKAYYIFFSTIVNNKSNRGMGLTILPSAQIKPPIFFHFENLGLPFFYIALH